MAPARLTTDDRLRIPHPAQRATFGRAVLLDAARAPLDDRAAERRHAGRGGAVARALALFDAVRGEAAEFFERGVQVAGGDGAAAEEGEGGEGGGGVVGAEDGGGGGEGEGGEEVEEEEEMVHGGLMVFW